MGFVDGLVIRERHECRRRPDPEARDHRQRLAGRHARRRSTPSISTPSGSVTSAGHEGYIARQLKRWYGQWNAQKTRETCPPSTRCTTACSSRIPEQVAASIVHGDYRLDNCMVRPDGPRRRRARLGDLHARRPHGRRRAAAGLLDRSRRRAQRVERRRHRAPRASAAATRCWRATPRCRGGTCRPSTSTSPSPTGSWPASSKACTPATSGAPGASTTPPGYEQFARQVEACAEQAAGVRRPRCRDGRPDHLHRAPRRSTARCSWSPSRVGSTPVPAPPSPCRDRAHGHHARGPSPRFDTDTFIDYRARRPIMQLRDGVNTGLQWPSIELATGRTGDGVDLLLLTGAEPDSAWRLFVDTVAAVAVRVRRPQMVGLGAYPFAAPHTRPARLSVTCSTRRIWPSRSPTCARRSTCPPAPPPPSQERLGASTTCPASGCGPRCPTTPRPCPTRRAAAALLDGLGLAAGVRVDPSALLREALDQARRLDELVSGSARAHGHAPPARGGVGRRRHRGAGPRPSSDLGPLPTGDELAAELERFLRDQGKADPPGQRAAGGDRWLRDRAGSAATVRP